MSRSEMYDPEMESMPREARAQYYDRRLAEAIAHAYTSTTAIKRALDGAGIAPDEVRTVADLERLPMIDKESLPAQQGADPPFGGLLAVPVASLRRIFVSPGPIYEPEGRDEDHSGLAKVLFAAGFRAGDIVLNTYMYHLVPAGLNVDGGLIRLGAVVVPVGVGNTELQVKIAHDLGANGFVGTPSFLATMINRTEELGHDFRSYLKISKALLGAEKLAGSAAKKFEACGIDYREVYGTADLGIIAYQCAERQGMHIAEETIVEIVDPETGRQLGPGQQGEVVVTSLKPTYPLIRFRTGDLSYFREDPCACGRTSHRLAGILGRCGEAIKVRGMFVHPGQVAAALSAFAELREHQLVVTRSGERDITTLRVEPRPGAEANQAALIDQIQSRFREVCRVGCDDVQVCPPGALAGLDKRIDDQRSWD